jgi:hypothetical protein
MNLPLAQSVVNELPSKVQALLAMKGQFVSIVYGKECQMRKGINSPQVYKFSTMTLRCGIEFDNIQAVQDKRISGELPSENQGLSWGRYVPNLYPYIIEHNSELYFRFFTVPGSKHISPTYVCDGKEITREEAMVVCTAKDFQVRETTLETMTLKISGILSINGKEVV